MARSGNGWRLGVTTCLNLFFADIPLPARLVFLSIRV